MNKVVMLQPLTPDLTEKVLSLVPEGFTMQIAKTTDMDELKELIGDADYAVAFGMAVEPELLRAAKKLKLLHRWGVGLDGTPIETAKELNIPIARTTGSNARPVAEFTVGAMIATSRHLVIAHRGMESGQWLKKQLWPRLFMLTGRTVGIIGLGTIGKHVAQRLGGFECRIIYHNRNRIAEAEEKALSVEYAALDDLIEQSDVITLHVPLTDETRGLISKPQLQKMKNSAALINTARGGVVSEADLTWALKTGEIRSAVLDVFEQEPPDPDNPLLHMENVIATPHIAAIAYDNIDNGIRHWFGNFQRHAAGEPIPERDIVVAKR